VYTAGNLLLMVTVNNGPSGAFPVPAGWTAVSGSPWTYGGAVIPPAIWTDQHIMMCWKITSTTTSTTTDGPSFSLDPYDDENSASAGGRVYSFRMLDDLLGEVPFTATPPIVASSLVSYDGQIVRPPQQTDPGRAFQTVTYPALDAGISGDHSWMAFTFIHGSFPLDQLGLPAGDDKPNNMVVIDPPPTGPEAGIPPGAHQGPNDTFDHLFAEGAYFNAFHAGDTVPNTMQTFQPDPTYHSLVGRDFDLFGDPYNYLPPVAGITMVVLGANVLDCYPAYWGINATTPA
jgi:hypothetical protein